MTTRVRKAVFPVGGLGTRFLPATKAMPKEMLPVVDRPLIQYAVEEARDAGIEEFIFVTGRGKSAIEDHFDQSFELQETLARSGKTEFLDLVRDIVPDAGSVAYTRQQTPLGLGHAVWCARHLVGNEPFAILLADDLVLSDTPCLAQLLARYGSVGGNVVAVMDVPREQTNRYGILDAGAECERLVEIKGLVEKPEPDQAPSTLSVIGRYILQPEIFTQLDRHDRGSGGEIQLTDAMAALIGPMPFHGYRFDGRRYDCGSKIGFLEANIAFALANDELRDDTLRLLRRTLDATN